jgi:hypothetical protein
MNSLEIPERDLYVEYPSCWEELSDEQFSYIIQNWIKLMDDKINIDEFNLIVLYRLLGVKRSPFDAQREKRMSKKQLEDKYANIWQLTLTLDWIIRHEEDEKGNPVGLLNYTGIENRYPFIDTENETFQGPSDCLIDISFGEYRSAWRYFESYSRTKSDADLDRLVASLYRPVSGKSIEGQRAPFNRDKIESYAKDMAEVPFWQKYAICLWFGNCDKYLKEGELELEGKPISFKPLFTRKRNTDATEVETLDENDLGLTGLLYMIADAGLFGTVAKTDKVNYIDVLTALLFYNQKAEKMNPL